MDCFYLIQTLKSTRLDGCMYPSSVTMQSCYRATPLSTKPQISTHAQPQYGAHMQSVLTRLSRSWRPSGLRCLLSGVIHGQDMYCGCGFESHWGHGWSSYPCKVINVLYY